MVCSNYREMTAVIDRAYAVPNQPMRWRGILASLADGLLRGIHPLQEMAEMESELRTTETLLPSPAPKSLLPEAG